jgi:hypothetical protein
VPDKKSRGISNLPVAIPDVPDAPTVSASDVGTSRAYNNGAATVTITPVTGGLPSSYSITTTPTTSTTTATSSPVTLTNLSSATSYTVSVVPSNVSITGPIAGTSSSFTATTVPQAPSSVVGTATAGSVSVAFTAGATGGSAVTSYTVLSSSGNSNTGASSPIIVTETVNGTYTYTVTATNANGTSLSSAASLGVVVTLPAFESIATATGTGSASTVTFSSIPSTYKHLQIRFRIKDTENLGSRNTNIFRLNFNGDTTAGAYSFHDLSGDGSAAGTNAGSSSLITANQCVISSLPAEDQMCTVGIIDVTDYASSTRNKTVKMFIGADANFASTQYKVRLSSGAWYNTNAITSVTVGIQGGGNLTTSSSIALYGIKG